MSGMLRLLISAILCAAAGCAQYRAERIGAPPADVAAQIAGIVDHEGFLIRQGDAPYCEIWLRRADEGARDAQKSEKPGVTLPGVAEGELLGVLHFDQEAQDRRGQAIRAGFYTLRYAVM